MSNWAQPSMQPPPITASLVLQHNKVLRNAYTLLSMMFVAGAAAAAVTFNTGFSVHYLVFLLVAIAFPFAINAARTSVLGLVLAFAYAAFLGAIIGPVIRNYAAINPMIPVYAFSATALIFGSMTVYGLTTKKDYSFMGSFLGAASIMVVLSCVALYFLKMTILGVVLSGVIVLMAAAWILYDTQQAARNGETSYIMLATSLFGSIWSLMMNLMHLIGFAED
jgi:modulator of FtsH protease